MSECDMCYNVASWMCAGPISSNTYEGWCCKCNAHHILDVTWDRSDPDYVKVESVDHKTDKKRYPKSSTLISMRGTELDKRFAQEEVYETICPNCSEEVDIAIHQLGYAIAGKEYDLNGYCEECDHEWVVGTISADVKIIIEEK